jgi:hypothetical protein
MVFSGQLGWGRRREEENVFTRVAVYAAMGLMLILVALFVAAALTGHCRRGYKVLPADAKTVIGGEELHLRKIATQYQPAIFLREDTLSPPGIKMWYEAVQEDESLVLIYHPAWENEIHPNPILHGLYSAYRAVYYGLPLWDIEYIQININREDGTIRKVRYETSVSGDYYRVISPHCYAFINKDDGTYSKKVIDSDGKVIEETTNISLSLRDGHRLSFGILTWSHQLILLDADLDGHTIEMPMPLEYLSEQDYAKYKFCRKSQGDYITAENKISSGVLAIISFLVIALPGLILAKKLHTIPDARRNAQGRR